LVFERKSGQSLDAEISGLFTYAGYREVFLKEHLLIAKEMLAEKWILGPDLQKVSNQTDLVQLSGDVQQRYYNDYIRIWDRLLADIRVVPFVDPRQAVEVLNILSGPNSPLRRLFKIVEQETRLSRLPPGAEQAGKLAERKFSRLTGKLASILQVSPDRGAEPSKTPQLSTPVDRHFAKLHEMVQALEGDQAPLDRSLAMLNELYVHMNSISSAANQSSQAFNAAQDPAAGSVINRIKLEAKRQPEPLADLLTSVAEGSSNLTVSGVREHLNAVWRTQVLPFYQRSLAGRYPLDRNGEREVTISDFGRFFGAGGLMDNFFRDYLQNFVDTSSRVWRWTASGNQALGIPSGTLRQFQRAAVIRDTFFRDGGQQPKIHFDMKPLEMDTSISQITLLLNDQRITYNHGPTRWSRMSWPDDSGISDAKALLSPPAGDKPSGVSEDGPWGWFRLLDHAQTSQTGSPETLQVEFSIGGRNARFLLRASSALNPFQLRELEDFWCPSRL
jgi:type VI secretion system protein ImpL